MHGKGDVVKRKRVFGGTWMVWQAKILTLGKHCDGQFFLSFYKNSTLLHIVRSMFCSRHAYPHR